MRLPMPARPIRNPSLCGRFSTERFSLPCKRRTWYLPRFHLFKLSRPGWPEVAGTNPCLYILKVQRLRLRGQRRWCPSGRVSRACYGTCTCPVPSEPEAFPGGGGVVRGKRTPLSHSAQTPRPGAPPSLHLSPTALPRQSGATIFATVF